MEFLWLISRNFKSWKVWLKTRCWKPKSLKQYKLEIEKGFVLYLCNLKSPVQFGFYSFLFVDLLSIIVKAAAAVASSQNWAKKRRPDLYFCSLGPSIKDVDKYFRVFDSCLPHHNCRTNQKKCTFVYTYQLFKLMYQTHAILIRSWLETALEY